MCCCAGKLAVEVGRRPSCPVLANVCLVSRPLALKGSVAIHTDRQHTSGSLSSIYGAGVHVNLAQMRRLDYILIPIAYIRPLPPRPLKIFPGRRGQIAMHPPGGSRVQPFLSLRWLHVASLLLLISACRLTRTVTAEESRALAKHYFPPDIKVGKSPGTEIDIWGRGVTSDNAYNCFGRWSRIATRPERNDMQIFPLFLLRRQILYQLRLITRICVVLRRTRFVVNSLEYLD